MQPRSQGFFPKKRGKAGKILLGVASLLAPILRMKFNFTTLKIVTLQQANQKKTIDRPMQGPFPALPIFLRKKPWERGCEVVEKLGFGIALFSS